MRDIGLGINGKFVYKGGRRGGVVVSAPVWTPDREVRVRALARSLCCVLGHTLSQCLSPPRSINGYLRTVRET